MGVNRPLPRQLLTTPCRHGNVLFSARLSLHMRLRMPASFPRDLIWNTAHTLADKGVKAEGLDVETLSSGGRGEVFAIRLNRDWRMVLGVLRDGRILLSAVCAESWWELAQSEGTRAFADTLEELLSLSNMGLPIPPAAPSSARRLLRAAARFAGDSRAHLQDEWTNALLDAPEGERAPSPRQQRNLAAGFLLAAVKMRTRDLAAGMWRPVDWVLADDGRIRVLISGTVGAQAVYIVGDGGLNALVTEIWEPCGITGAALYGLTRYLRRRRGVEIAGHLPRDSRE